jgi:guanylate kinase
MQTASSVARTDRVPEVAAPLRELQVQTSQVDLLGMWITWPKFLFFAGPSASGKSSLMNEIKIRDPRVHWISSYTNRKPRSGDFPGEYSYVTDKKFASMAEEGEFLWTAGPHGNRYGTLKSDLVTALTSDTLSMLHAVPACLPLLHDFAPSKVYPFFVHVDHPRIVLPQRMRKRDPNYDHADCERRVKECLDWEVQARKSTLRYKFVNNSHKLEMAYSVVLNALRKPANLSA